MKLLERINIFLPALIFSMNMLFSQSSNNKLENISEQAKTAKLIYPTLVDKFYELNQQQLFWFLSDDNSPLLRKALKDCIDSSNNIGLDKFNYHYEEISENTSGFSPLSNQLDSMSKDRVFTDAAIALSKNVYQGINISSWINADQISIKYSDADDDYLLNKLATSKFDFSLREYINSLEPREKEYVLLKIELQMRLKIMDSGAIKQLITSLNLFRWLHHFRLDKYIVVNIPSATLRYYEYDSIMLKMKVVVGKPSTRTPRFAAYCNEIILYPYWNVPRKIVVDELLPMFKRVPASVDSMNMQVIDRKGNIIDHHKLEWSVFNKKNFPYGIRQSTGCDNALGVIKFNLSSPFDVYLHDTNFKFAFLSKRRYLSHGCIRLEKPIELANYLLYNRLDNKFLESCLKGQKPVPLQLEKNIPVFVVYISAEADDSGKLSYYKDVYNLLK